MTVDNPKLFWHDQKGQPVVLDGWINADTGGPWNAEELKTLLMLSDEAFAVVFSYLRPSPELAGAVLEIISLLDADEWRRVESIANGQIIGPRLEKMRIDVRRCNGNGGRGNTRGVTG